MEPFIGEVRIFGGNFAPKDWAFCQGAIINITQNPALYAILGNAYGGDGVNTFALPDFRGRTPIGTGHGPGSQYNWERGHKGGSETKTLVVDQLPAHAHAIALDTSGSITATLHASGDAATATGANNKYLAETEVNTYLNNNGNPKELNAGAITIDAGSLGVTVDSAGGSTPISLLQPVLAVNYIISLQGIFPPRN